MKILIFGASGMLGHKLVQMLGERFDCRWTIRGGFESIEGFGIFERERTIEHIGVDDVETVRRAIEIARPDVVVNAVGVIKQLPSAKNVITTLTVNSIFPHRLAQLSVEYGFRLISVSTDCVFDGVRGFYDEDDLPNATDLYGKSKYLGEVTGSNCLTVRSSIIGRELSTSHSLVEWFLSNRGGRVQGYTNAIYSGFPTVEFADIITSLICDHNDLSGLYHIASDPINKFELLKLIDQYYEAGVEIVPSDELAIDRSLNPQRFNLATGFKPKAWEQMIARMAADTTPYDDWRQ